MNVEQLVGDKTKVLRENPPQCHFIHHKSHDLTWTVFLATGELFCKKRHAMSCGMVYINNMPLTHTSKSHSKWVKSWFGKKKSFTFTKVVPVPN
jgi:hypothetical protein